MLKIKNFPFLILTAVLLATALFGQQPTAEVTGIVSDASGASVPAAQIRLTNTATGIRWDAQSNESGNYTFSNLPPGPYEITVTREGFNTLNRRNINLVISQVARIDFTLNIGSTSESIDIKATAPLLESSTASVGQLIETRAVSDLPLNGRNFLQLAKLSTGVLEAKPGDRNAAGGSFIANGV